MCQTWLGVECDSIGKVTRVSLMEGELVGDVEGVVVLAERASAVSIMVGVVPATLGFDHAIVSVSSTWMRDEA